jgi:RTX calcium-binding nonapeptide repeat (4 copies)/WD40-like Beta Propeller Repeat
MSRVTLAGAAALASALLVGVSVAVSASSSARPGFDAAPRISPDGRWIVFERSFASGSRYSPPRRSLRLVDAAGQAERELVPVTDRYFAAGWTADNLIRISHGGETFLVRPEDGRNVGPALPAFGSSPDGRWIAYRRGGALWVSAPDGSNARQVAPSFFEFGAFSPDSTRLTYTAARDFDSVTSEVVAIDGTGRVSLKRAPVAGPGNWAPDGRSVVLMAQNADRYRYRPPTIYVASADGTSVRRLVRGFAISPDWSPRGDWIAFTGQVRVRREDRYYLMLVRPDGSGLGRVRLGIDRQRSAGATWLSDGRRMLTSDSEACRRAGIVEIDIDRGTLKRLTNRCRIAGTRGADNLRGTDLRDILHGLGGDDRISGRGGNDDLFGGPGDDVLLARDGRTDHLDCGPGRDSALADRQDRVSRTCERVLRRR